MSTLRRYGGRLAALGLLLGLAIAVYGLLAIPLVEAHNRLDRKRVEATEQFDRYAQIAAKRPAVKALIARLKTRKAATGIYLNGNTDPLAAVDLQERINTHVKRTGGKVQSIQVLETETGEGYRRVAISVKLTATMSAFHRLIYAVEASRPFLVIRNLDIKSTRRSAKKGDQTEEPKLLIRFEVCGFRKPVTA
jgi:hypothetical protein